MTKKTAATMAALAFFLGCASPTPPPREEDAETRIIRYLEENIRAGRPVVVAELRDEVFPSPEEQAALNRLFNTFFKIPIFMAQFESTTGRVPTLEEISEQFSFTIPGQTEIMLRVMEFDPRIPHFFERDPDTGEITSLDVEAIRNDPQFGQEIERSLAGWEGRSLPAFSMEAFDGTVFDSADLEGSPYLVYVWFSNCPPCLQTSPLLVELYEKYRDRGFEIVAANADRLLRLPYDDQMRLDYVNELNMRFVTTHLTDEVLNSLGGVTIFPTMFFVNSEGTVVRHFMNFQEAEVLEEAIQAAL